MELQEIVTLAIVAVAAAFLGRYLWREIAGGSGGGSCSRCSGCAKTAFKPRSGSDSAPSPLITLQAGRRTAHPEPGTRDAGK